MTSRKLSELLEQLNKARPRIADAALGLSTGGVVVVVRNETSDRLSRALGLGHAEPICAWFLAICLLVWATCRDPNH